MTCTLTVLGKAEPKGSLRGFVLRGSRRVVLTDGNPRVRPWMALIRDAAAQWRADQGLADHAIAWPTEPILLDVTVWLPKPKSAPTRRAIQATKKPDVSKIVRAVEDALTGVLYRDDAQITVEIARKDYAARDEQPRTVITVEALS